MAPAMSPWRSSSTGSHLPRRNPFSLFSNHNDDHEVSTPTTSHLGILAFDTAKTISRLISVYKSLADTEINRLRKETIKSKGVSYLNSEDEGYLVTLACAERLEELDHTATILISLTKRCTDPALIHFDTVYRDLKLGILDHDKLAHSYASKEIERKVDKMEKRISYTSYLYSDLQRLAELEASEKKVSDFKRALKSQLSQSQSHSHFNFHSPSQSQSQSQSPTQTHNGWSGTKEMPGTVTQMKHNIEQFEQKIASLRKSVKHLKETSLWSCKYDKTLGFMARVLCISYARICVHFRPYVGILPSASGFKAKGVRGNNLHDPFIMSLFEHVSLSGPLDMSNGHMSTTGSSPDNQKAGLVRFFSANSSVGPPVVAGSGIRSCKSGSDHTFRSGSLSYEGGCIHGYIDLQSNKNKVYQAAPPSTVGGSGLAIRYANLILVAEQFLQRNSAIDDQDKDELYDMLPASLRSQVRLKLKRAWREFEKESHGRSSSYSGEIEEDLALGWREATGGILQWLGQMANDTLAWHSERNMERQQFEVGASVLLLQTLHFSDLEKTEAAIVEVLVGLSYISRYENRRLAEDDGGS